MEPETQAKVDQLLLEAKGLYNAMLAAKPPASLAYALRDGTPFEQLTDEAVLGAVQVVAQIRKANAAAEAAAQNGAGKTEPVTPTEVLPPPPQKRKAADAAK